MVRPRAPTVRWLVIVAALVIGPAANSEPIHLACEGAMERDQIEAQSEVYLKNTSCRW